MIVFVCDGFNKWWDDYFYMCFIVNKIILVFL